MYKKFFNIIVLMITVLTVNLLTNYITNYIINYKTYVNPYKYTAIAMLALVFILVPAFSYMSNRVEYLIAKVLLSGSNSFGKITGLFISFVFIFGILFIIYLNDWFNINLLLEFKKKVLSYF